MPYPRTMSCRWCSLFVPHFVKSVDWLCVGGGCEKVLWFFFDSNAALLSIGPFSFSILEVSRPTDESVCPCFTRLLK